jgi:hypothetical protein
MINLGGRVCQSIMKEIEILLAEFPAWETTARITPLPI